MCARSIRLLACSLVLLNCGTGNDANDDVDRLQRGHIAALTAAESACMTTVANSCYYDAVFFDHDLQWDSRAAAALVETRAGRDGLCGTSDDVVFTDAEDIGQLAYVGDWALGRLLNFVAALGCLDTAAVVDGVGFSQAQALATIEAVNLASRGQLKHEAHLGTKAIESVLLARPFGVQSPRQGLEQLAAVKFIGPVSMKKLREFGMRFTAEAGVCDALADTVASVSFTGIQAYNTLDLANYGSVVDLMRIPDIGELLAKRILSVRDIAPFDSILALAKVDGIGAKRLLSLRNSVGAYWCTTGSADCGCSGAVREAVPAIIMEAKRLLSDPETKQIKRFRELLSTERMQVFIVAIEQIIAAELWFELPAQWDNPNAAAIARVTETLSQSLFTNPFSVIEPTRAKGNDFLSSLDAVTDALIMALNAYDFESTDIGVSFSELIEGDLEADYLKDINDWRTWRNPDFVFTPLSHSWIFSGSVAGIPAQVTISRQTGNILGVEFL